MPLIEDVANQLRNDYVHLWAGAAAIIGCNPDDPRCRTDINLIAVFTKLVQQYVERHGFSFADMSLFFSVMGGRLKSALDYNTQFGQVGEKAPPIPMVEHAPLSAILNDYGKLWESAAKISGVDPNALSSRTNQTTVQIFTDLVAEYLERRGHTFEALERAYPDIGGRLGLAYQCNRDNPVRPQPAQQAGMAEREDRFDSVAFDKQNVKNLVQQACAKGRHLFDIVGANTDELLNNPASLRKFLHALLQKKHPDKAPEAREECVAAATALLELIKNNQLEAYKAGLAAKGMRVAASAPAALARQEPP